MMPRWRLCLLGLAGALLVACAAPDPLPRKDAAVPVGVDLTGRWQLRDDSRDSNREIQAALRKASGAGESLVPKSNKKSKRRKDEMQVHVFLESGESLKLTQTEHGLFVSFDRAVVEEYRFGEQRMANVGPVAAERVSGWENGAYVIETRDKEGAMLIEAYRLEGPDLMVRTVRIVHDEAVVLDARQYFARSGPGV
jgi:hypothetical protein